MIEDNHTNENKKELALMHLFTEFEHNISVPKQVFLTEAEAELLADYFLTLIWGMLAGIGHCSCWSRWELYMYPYSHERLGALVKSGLVTEKFIDDWWEANPVPEDDPSYEAWEDSILSKDSLPDRPSSDIDSDDDIPF